jgi:hypothetical protein
LDVNAISDYVDLLCTHEIRLRVDALTQPHLELQTQERGKVLTSEANPLGEQSPLEVAKIDCLPNNDPPSRVRLNNSPLRLINLNPQSRLQFHGKKQSAFNRDGCSTLCELTTSLFHIK